MLRWLVPIAFVGCGDQAAPTDAPVRFAYHATVGWSSVETPQVTGVTVDSTPIPQSGFEIDESYSSRDVAIAEFTPRVVQVITTNETLTFELQIDSCLTYPSAPVTREEEYFSVDLSLVEPSRIVFGAGCGYCVVGSTVQAWCT